MRSKLMGAALGVGAALAFSACGSSTGSPSTSTLAPLTVTAFATVPTTPTTIATTTLPGQVGGVIAGESTYTVQPGDYPSTIAAKFKVKYADLASLNGWDPAANVIAAFKVGLVVKIPAGATAPGASADTTTTVPVGGVPATTTAGGAAPATTTTVKASGKTTTTVAGAGTPTTAAGAGGNCAAGSYTITAADNAKIKVANKFNVTVAQLDAANAATKGYSGFYPGLKIVIPAKANC
jgi:LysM repeat protein